jgi:hypothetical protein
MQLLEDPSRHEERDRRFQGTPLPAERSLAESPMEKATSGRTLAQAAHVVRWSERVNRFRSVRHGTGSRAGFLSRMSSMSWLPTARPAYWRLGFSGYRPADSPAKCGLGDRGRSSAHPNRTPRPLGERCCRRRSSGRRDNGTTTEAADRLRTTITLCFRHRSAEHRPADQSESSRND